MDLMRKNIPAVPLSPVRRIVASLAAARLAFSSRRCVTGSFDSSRGRNR